MAQECAPPGVCGERSCLSSLVYDVWEPQPRRSSPESQSSILKNRKAENLCWPKNMRMGVYRSFIHSCRTLEAAKRSFSGWTGKRTAAHADSGILFSHRKKWALQPREYLMETETHTLLRERSQSRRAACVLRHPSFITCCKRRNCGHSRKIGGCWGPGGGREEEAGHRRLLGKRNYSG